MSSEKKTLQNIGVQILEKASTDTQIREKLKENAAQVLRDHGIEIPANVENDLNEYLKTNLTTTLDGMSSDMLGANPFGCAACKVGCAAAVIILAAALAAAVIASGGSLAAALAACSGAIATCAAAVGISAALLTTILSAFTSFSVGAIIIAICKATKAC